MYRFCRKRHFWSSWTLWHKILPILLKFKHYFYTKEIRKCFFFIFTNSPNLLKLAKIKKIAKRKKPYLGISLNAIRGFCLKRSGIMLWCSRHRLSRTYLILFLVENFFRCFFVFKTLPPLSKRHHLIYAMKTNIFDLVST